MSSLNILALVAITYVMVLFWVAFWADRQAARGQGAAFLKSSLIYTLSLSVYCTAWTFYGAVGNAARSGLEFLAIYLGPTLVMLGWWWGLRKLVRVARTLRVSSIADLLSARYGKSNLLAIAVTLLAVVGVTPYIALQLQSITLSLEAFAEVDGRNLSPRQGSVFWVSVGLAVFAILFGTRNLNANERHHGVVMAIALEAVVKLFALIAVGSFVVWGVAGGVGETLARIDASEIGAWHADGGRWVSITFLAAAAFVCLPRMFQVMVVENEDERHLRIASWAFPSYLFLISIFVVPIAVIGLETLPAGSNPDLFVLTLPLSQGHQGLAMLAFLGGFSSATSMVIVAAMSLSIMISNHIVMPIWLRRSSASDGASVSGDVRSVLLYARRISIAVIMFLGYAYYQISGGGVALASIGFVAFSGIAQILPALVGGLFWRGATRVGALTGLTLGFFVWSYTLLLPELAVGVFSDEMMAQGPMGISFLRPQALFGIEGLDPVVHCALWSMLLNIGSFCAASIASFPSPLERLQGAQVVNVFDHSVGPGGWTGTIAQSEDLMVMSQRILGADEAQSFFARWVEKQGGDGTLPEPTPAFLEQLERELSASIGSAAAHAMIGQIASGASVSVEDLLAVADESAQLLEYSNRLELQSQELAVTARKLRETNHKLTQISEQKDAFLSQISHELRTPMTSVRAFSEILRDESELDPELQKKYAGIIHDDTLRLTRLLDDLLDLSVLEHGAVSLNVSEGRLGQVIKQAISSALPSNEGGIQVAVDPRVNTVEVCSDLDRLAQVFINLISNAQKYCVSDQPSMKIVLVDAGDLLTVDLIDNGEGVPEPLQGVIFEKFSRVTPERAGGAGLGLAICREIARRLGGDISYLSDYDGAAFRVSIARNYKVAEI